MSYANGEIYIKNIRSAANTDTYTFSGDENGETFVPSFTSHGFRYVEITGNGCELSDISLFQAISKRISLGGQFFLFCFAAFLFSDLLPKLFQRRITHMECPFPALRFFVQKLVQKMLPIIYKCFGDNVAVRIFICTL